MKKETVSHDNAIFFLIAVGMSMGLGEFAQEVLESDVVHGQFPTDNVGSPGYIRIDSSAIMRKGEEYWKEFVDKVRNGFLPMVSYGFSSKTKFQGELSEQVTIERDGFVFFFVIKEYERDAEHDFEIIKPEDLPNVPEKEKLGRVVYLTITPAG